MAALRTARREDGGRPRDRHPRLRLQFSANTTRRSLQRLCLDRAIAEYQRGSVGARDTNRVIENYFDAEQMLSRWADVSRQEDHIAFLDGPGAETFDWWGAPERERSTAVNNAIADRESRDRQGANVRWPWSKVQRSDSSKG